MVGIRIFCFRLLRFVLVHWVHCPHRLFALWKSSCFQIKRCIGWISQGICKCHDYSTQKESVSAATIATISKHLRGFCQALGLDGKHSRSYSHTIHAYVNQMNPQNDTRDFWLLWCWCCCRIHFDSKTCGGATEKVRRTALHRQSQHHAAWKNIPRRV